MIRKYWLIQIINGQPALWGPFETEAKRLDEYDMCLIDPGTEYLLFLDPDNVAEPGKPWLWKPSYQFRQERLDAINNDIVYTCPGCGRDTNIVINGANCPNCLGQD